jgi:hypothetical protein
MGVIFWSILAILAAFGAAAFAVRRARRRLPPLTLAPGESLPTTPLQRLARMTLVAASLPTLAAAALVAQRGAAFAESDPVRLTFTGLVVAALAVFAVYMGRVARWSARDDGPLDERDRAILVSAHAAQSPAMLVTLAAWTLGLVEAYQRTRLVPLEYLFLVFWSLILVSVLSLLAGVLLGYRRQ